jgi:hypothetical protein
MLVRGSAYRAAGGHEALRASVIDDIGLAIRVRRAGGRCRMALADDRVRLRMYRGFREVFDGFTKNMAYVFEGGLAYSSPPRPSSPSSPGVCRRSLAAAALGAGSRCATWRSLPSA